MLAAAVMHCGARRFWAQKAAKASASVSALVPRLQPTPSTPMRGTRCSASPAGQRVRAKSGSSPAVIPSGGAPAMGQSDANCTVLPASSAPLTSLMRSGSSTVQFWCFAHSSTANTPFASVAVVITGTAPHTAASARARSLAPPRWPERMGTAKRPHSSSTTTAWSCALLWQWGRPIGKVHLPGFMAAAGHAAGICRRQFLGQCKALCRKGKVGPGHWSVPLRNSVVKAGS